MKVHLKNEKKRKQISFIWWATLLNNSSYEPHGTFVSGFIFLLDQEGPEKPKSFCSLSSRGWNSLSGACSYLDLGNTITECNNYRPIGKRCLHMVAGFGTRYLGADVFVACCLSQKKFHMVANMLWFSRGCRWQKVGIKIRQLPERSGPRFVRSLVTSLIAISQ